MNNWVHKDEWHRRGKDFLVTVKRHSVELSDLSPHEGQHRWAVYAYIYPEHSYYKEFTTNEMWQSAALAMPLHCGPSYFRRHMDVDGKTTSVQVGADYHHLHDDRFSHYATDDDATRIFADADHLHDWLQARQA